jgi:hypothetical protein
MNLFLLGECSAMQLLCEVAGNIERAPPGFGASLCNRVSDMHKAELINRREFLNAIDNDADGTLAELLVTIVDSHGIKYTFASGTASQWQNNSVVRIELQVDITDGTLGRETIEHLARDIGRMLRST